MSHEKKQEVLEFLQDKDGIPNYEQYNEAFRLYRLHPGKLKSSEINYNRKGFTDQNLKNLLYDLQKIYGITDVEVIEPKPLKEVIKLNPVFHSFTEAFAKLDEVVKLSALNLLKFVDEFGGDIIFNTPVLSEYFKKDWETLSNLVPIVDQDSSDFVIEDIISYFENEIKDIQYSEELELIISENKEILLIAPIDLNPEKDDFIGDLSTSDFAFLKKIDYQESKQITSEESISLRDEFPFLNEPNCPDILFIVVGKRISTWKLYQELHALLQTINEGKVEMKEEEKLSIISQCEKAFNENTLLWNELNHYNLTGEILGKHPIFRESVSKREVDGMTNEELFKFKNASATYLSRKRSQLPKMANDLVKLEQLNKDIADREYMLSLVNAKIGVANAGTQTK